VEQAVAGGLWRWLGGRKIPHVTKHDFSQPSLASQRTLQSQMELVTMTDQAQSEILENNLIRKGLDAFRTSFNSICEDRTISCTSDALGQLAQEGTTVWRLFEYLLPV
jgi:hypothetical protein